MPTQTAIYCRTAEPDPADIADQRTALERLAEKRDFGAVAVYEDNGFSAREPRPAFTRLEQDIRAGEIARVLVTSVTRLGYNLEDVLRWARENPVEIYPLRRGN